MGVNFLSFQNEAPEGAIEQYFKDLGAGVSSVRIPKAFYLFILHFFS